MTGLAALVVSVAPNNEKIHVHYNTAKLNLAVILKNGEKGGEDVTKVYASKSDEKEGIIVNPSELGTSLLLGMNMVVGITKKNGSTTLNDISIVSPVYRPLTSTEIANTTVSVCVDGDNKNAWIYYLKGTDANTMKMYQYVLSDFSGSSTADSEGILKGSSLAAYYDTHNEKRFVIFQGKDNKNLYEYCVDSDSTTHMTDANNAFTGTPMAVVYNSEKTYLYYLSTSKKIELIKKDSSGWGSPSSRDKTADTSHQLTAAWSDGIPHVFYLPDNSSDIAHFRDKKAVS